MKEFGVKYCVGFSLNYRETYFRLQIIVSKLRTIQNFKTKLLRNTKHVDGSSDRIYFKFQFLSQREH